MMKTILLSYAILFGKSLYARSPKLKCSDEPLSKEEVLKLEEQIRKTNEFKNIGKLNAAITKIKVSRCNQIEGHVHTNFILLENILDKKCSISSMKFPFFINGENVKFDSIRFGKEKSLPKDLDRVLIIKTVENIAKSKKGKSFFEKNDYCQLEFRQDQKKFSWLMQLRYKKKFCFLEAATNGGKIREIKKMYAKPGDCNINEKK